MSTIRFNITPVPKPRQTRSDKWQQRPVVMRYRAFADELRSQVKGELEPILTLRFFMPMPASWPEAKKAQLDGQPHQARPDVDNLTKSILDALCSEDSYIYDIRAQKFWSRTGALEIEEHLSSL